MYANQYALRNTQVVISALPYRLFASPTQDAFFSVKQAPDGLFGHAPHLSDLRHGVMVLQRQRVDSRFIVLGTEPNWMQDEFRKTDSTIQLITIAAAARAQLRQDLRDCGITESVIYPDLDGLGREMKQLWEDRRVAPEENA
jgi:hypothetical protein